jgi:hypothetical protein
MSHIGKHRACVDDQHVDPPFDKVVGEQEAAVLFRILG